MPYTTRRRLLSMMPAIGIAGVTSLNGVSRAKAATPGSRTGLNFATQEAFKAVIDDLGDAVDPYADNLNGIIGWQTAYLLQAYLQMFVAHRRREYLDSFVFWADSILAMRDSERGVVDYRGLSLPGWSRVFPTFTDRMHQTVETGMATRPLALFARIVLNSPSLRSDNALLDRALTYRDAAADALAIHDPYWSNHRGPTGIYSYEKGMPHPYDGTECPFNMNHTLGSTAVHLAAAMPWERGQLRSRAQRIARLHLDDCREGANDAYVWNYQWTGSWGYRGWTEEDAVSVHEPSYPGNPWIEDVNHGALTAEFVADCGKDRIVYGRGALEGIARAINNALFLDEDPLRVSRWLDGSGPSRRDAEPHFVGTWACLAEYNPSICEAAQVVSDAYAFTGITSYRCSFALSVGHLNRAASGTASYDNLSI